MQARTPLVLVVCILLRHAHADLADHVHHVLALRDQNMDLTCRNFATIAKAQATRTTRAFGLFQKATTALSVVPEYMRWPKALSCFGIAC